MVAESNSDSNNSKRDLPSAAGANAEVAPSAADDPAAPWPWKWFLLLMGCTALMSFWHLSGGADFEPTDAWVAQTAREMSESRDWRGYVIPIFSGEVRMQKSPGPYWAVCLTAWLRGTPVDVVATRIHSAISALALVATVFWLSLRIGGERIAIFSGFAASASVLVLYWSHRGASDLGVTLFCTLSLACLWIGSECAPPGRKRVLLWLAGYFAAGLGMLYKFPVPLLAVGVPAVLYVVVCRRWEIFRSAWHLLGLLAFALPWLPWVIALALLQSSAAAESGVDFMTTLNKWRVEFWDRVTGDLPNVEGQRGDWTMYVLYVGVAFVFTVPWCLSIVPAIVRALRPIAGVSDRGRWFLLLWVGGIFLALQIQAGKETRYMLPALPPLLILLGIELSAFFSPSRRANPLLERLGGFGAMLIAPAGWAAGAYLLQKIIRNYGEYAEFSWNDVQMPFLVTAAISSAGVILAARLYVARKEHAAFGALVVMMYATWLWVWPNLMPILAAERPFIDFAEQLRERVPAELRPHIAQVAQQDPRIIWHSDVRIPRVIDQLVLLKMQGGRRSREAETRIIAEEMIRRLRGDQPALFVIEPTVYAAFLIGGTAELEKRGERMPACHVWLTGRIGRPDHRYVLFGNRPPPWTEPRFGLPRRIIEEVLRQLQLSQSVVAEKLIITREPTDVRGDEPVGALPKPFPNEPPAPPGPDTQPGGG